MSDPSKGRGRGLMLIQKAQSLQSHAASPEPGASETASTASEQPSMSTSILSGRGRASLLMSKVKPPGVPTFSPATDVSPSLPPPRGVGRGLKLLQNLTQRKPAEPASSSVSEITDQMSTTTLESKQTIVGKNKYLNEVKTTPPVIKKGTSGTPCEVTSNYINLIFKENNVFEYEVTYNPNQDYKHLRFKLLNQHKHLFQEKTFDGTTLYIPNRLPDDVTELVSDNPFDDSKVKVNIIFRRCRRLSEMIHIYNVLFANIMRDLKLVRFNRQYYNQKSAVTIPQHKLEVWPGYVTAVNEYEGGLMLMLDSSHRVLRTETVLSLIKDTIQENGANWKKALSEILIGCSVMTTYNKKLFRVDSIDETMTPLSTFEKNEGGVTVKISYLDYYKKNYGLDIMDVNQPMLIHRETKRMPGIEKPTDFMICLVPELCQLTGLSDAQRGNFRLMKDVATYTRVTPQQRLAAFKQYIKNINSNESAKQRLAGWGLSLAPDTVQLTARTLPPEPLYFGNDQKVPGKPNADWNMDACRNPVLQAVDIVNWVLLYAKKDHQVALNFAEIVCRCGPPMGVRVAKPNAVQLPSDRTDAYVTAIKKNVAGVQLIVAICPTSRDDRYAAIKKICCAENPVPSQVINARTLMNSQKVKSITQKILLQMNCKLGGTLWSISMPCKMAMVVGIDSYHDASRKNASICAFVSSFNSTMTRWYSRAVSQPRGQELGDALKYCLLDALRHYLAANGELPSRIIIYRDGVGDGELNLLRDYEIPQLRVSFSVLDKEYNPSLTYIVVQKRINSRIFMKTHSGFENPPPGTVLDHDITRRDWYDFLIASQKVNQGTVTPTHYVVVYDDSPMTADQCQRLTYKLCHLYYNWPGTVRVPAPVQYAHKLAYLVGQTMHQQPSELLADKLFFL